jgi:hypothetical protein
VRTKQKAAFVLISCFLLLAFGIAAAPWVVDLNNYKDVIVDQIQQATRGKCRMGRISWGISKGLWVEVDGLSIVGAEPLGGDVTLSRAFADVSLLPLLSGKVTINTLLVDVADVRISLAHRQSSGNDHQSGTPGYKNNRPAETNSVPISKPIAFLPLSDVYIKKAVVTIRKAVIVDAIRPATLPIAHRLDDVNITVTGVAPGREMAFAVSMRDRSDIGYGRLDVEGTFNGFAEAFVLRKPHLKLKAALTSLSMDVVRPYLTNSRLATRLGGTVSASVDYEIGSEGSHRVRGSINIGSLAYLDESLWDHPLPGRNTTLIFQAVIDSRDFALDSAVLKLGNLSLTAQGLVENWLNQPTLKTAKLSYDFPLEELVPLVPWRYLGKNAQPLRPMLEAGGRITSDRLTLPDTVLASPVDNWDAWISGIETTARVSGLSIQPNPKLPGIELLSGNLYLANGVLGFEKLQLRTAFSDLPEVSATVSELLTGPRIAVRMHGRMDIKTPADQEMGALLKRIGLSTLSGQADIDLRVALDSRKPQDWILFGKVGLSGVRAQSPFTPAQIEDFNADILLSPKTAKVLSANASIRVPAAGDAEGGQFALNLKGAVDEWFSQPTLVLEDINTSPISLALAARLVPWDTFGASADFWKQVMCAGGAATVDSGSMPAMVLSGSADEVAQALKGLTLAATLKDLTVPTGASLPLIERLGGQVRLENQLLTATDVHARMGPLTFPTVTVRVTDLIDRPQADFRAIGPMRLSATEDEGFRLLLQRYGLKRLSGKAEVVLQVSYDHTASDRWQTSGEATLVEVRAETLLGAVSLEKVNGHIVFDQNSTLTVAANDITARVNTSPVRLSGRLVRIGAPDMKVAGRVYTRGLDISSLAVLIPSLENLDLQSRLDLNASIDLPYADPKKTRLSGTMAARGVGFTLVTHGLTVSDGTLDVDFIGDGARITSMTADVNGQKLRATGVLSNPTKPHATLSVSASELNLDRLLPHPSSSRSLTETPEEIQPQTALTSGDAAPATQDSASASPLSAWLRPWVADFDLQAASGRYRGLDFKRLDMGLSYADGIISGGHMNVDIDDGRIAVKGASNLRNLDNVTYKLQPDIRAIPLRSVERLLGLEPLPIEGQLSLKGVLDGKTASPEALLQSLSGEVSVEMGPGKIKQLGKAGTIVFDILDIANIRDLFSGKILEDSVGRALAYKSLGGKAAFGEGMVRVKALTLSSNALSAHGKGKIDLINQNIDGHVDLLPLPTFKKIASDLPVIRREAGKVASIRVHVRGPLKNPHIRPVPAEGLVEKATEVFKLPATLIENSGKSLEDADR